MKKGVVQGFERACCRRSYGDEAFPSIVEALVPEVPPPQDELVEARMTAEARVPVEQRLVNLVGARTMRARNYALACPSLPAR